MGNNEAKPEAPESPPGVVPLPPGYLYHAFLSYRRMGGRNHLAALIAAELTHAGFKVFFDVDSMQTAVFDTAILTSLRASCCDVFVLVPGTLDRCFNDPENKDWVRLEIAEACHLGKAIIPVVEGDTFPNTDGLPADMANFPRHNALMWSFHLKKHCINELVERVNLAVKNARPFASLPPPRSPPDAPRPTPSPPPSLPPAAFSAQKPATAPAAELPVAAGASIMEAVWKAGPGQTIRLAPGRYQEAVVLAKDVHIVGPREAVLECDKGTTLQCKGHAAPTVRGITIRCTAPNGPAVWITGGSRATLEGCDVSSASLNGIEASGEGTVPAIRSNVVHDCGGAGIVFYKSAKGDVEENDVFGNATPGIQIQEGADPSVCANKVHDGKAGGIVVLDNGRGTVRLNDVFGNALAGIGISKGGDPVVRGNKIHDQKAGIYVREGGKGRISGNTLERIGGGKSAAINVGADCADCVIEQNTIKT